MNAKVAVIVSTFLETYINDIIAILPQPEDFKVYCYTDFYSLSGVYESIPSHIKGVVTSGLFPQRILQLSYPETTREIKVFNNDDAGVYRLILEILNQHRGLDFSRVYFDALDIAGFSCGEYLFGSYEPGISEIQYNNISKLSLDELLTCEEQFAGKHIRLWKEKKIDISITRFSSIVKRLENEGATVRFAYPDKFYTKAILAAAVADVTIDKLTENLTCCIFVTINAHKGESMPDEKMRKLRQSVNAFGAHMNLSFHVEEKKSGVEIFTNKESAIRITENFTTCKLRGFLASELSFDVCIGYGIGFSLYQARINSVDAHSEAYILPYGASCLINEKDQLISPLHGEMKLVVSRNHSETVKQFAKASGLSCLTIQKIMSVTNQSENNLVTSDMLAYSLSITKRSANRILMSLKKSGLAHVAERKQDTSKGRPEYIYEINLQLSNENKV